ncbi:hypothetical protein [Plantactinospora sp. GCM10030261]|uniref:hypothetical protein n=1 Tax=Plantactinospora sp. GCM10030261 TaxID=3273420 RepID=UPI00360EFC52
MNARTWRVAAGLALGLVMIAGTQLGGAPQASALPSWQRVSATSLTDSEPVKTAIAACPAGKVVVGGGGWVFALAAADDAKVMVTGLEPVHSGNLDSYVASGAEVAPGMTGTWWVEAYAICAAAPAGYEVVSGSTAPSSSTVQETAAGCGGTKRAIGTGARINNPGGQVSLQLARPSGPRDIARVTAKEDANGYAATWNVTAYAICANPISGFSVQGAPSTQTGSANAKSASVQCPVGTRLHSVAAATSGGTSLTDTPAGVAIQQVFPSSDQRTASVYAVETSPTNASWDLVAQAICGP